MAKFNLPDTFGESSSRHKFICRTCGAKGNWTPNYPKAKAEATDHSQKFPKHDVDIVNEYSVRTYNNFLK